MSDFSISVSWMMLNIIVCNQKLIFLTVFEKSELEKCCVRSVILEKYCLHSRDHIFGPIYFKLDQNGCLVDNSVNFDHGRGGVKK